MLSLHWHRRMCVTRETPYVDELVLMSETIEAFTNVNGGITKDGLSICKVYSAV